MFERTEIWERTADCIWIYVIYRDLRTGLFHVQQANAFYPGDPMLVTRALAHMNLSESELFWEQSPSDRSKGFATSSEAVEHHKTEFATIVPPTQPKP